MKCTNQWIFTCVTVTPPPKIRTSEHRLPLLRDHLSLPSQCHSTPPQLKTLLTPTAIEAFVYRPTSPGCSLMNFRLCWARETRQSRHHVIVERVVASLWNVEWREAEGVEVSVRKDLDRHDGWSRVGRVPVGCEGAPAADPGVCILIPSHSSSEVQREGLEIQCPRIPPGKWGCQQWHPSLGLMWSINQIVDVKCLDSVWPMANAIQVELLLCPGRLVGNECSKHTLYNTIPYCYQRKYTCDINM